MKKKIEPDTQKFDTGSEIRRIRGEMTQQAFAELLGVSSLTIIRYERNERVPDAEFLFKLNLLFGVDPAQIVLGRKTSCNNDPHEVAMLNNYRKLSEEDRRVVERIIQLAAQSITAKKDVDA